MSKKTDTIIDGLSKLGLTQEEITIYLYLNKNGSQTALDISRHTNLSRTKVYRILDTLTQKQIVTQNLKDRGFEFEAEPPSSLGLLLTKKQAEVNELAGIVPFLITSLDSVEKDEEEKGSVKYFKGKEGLKKITWNSLKSRTILIYEMDTNLSGFLDNKFAEDFRREMVKRRVHVRQLTNHKKIERFTKVHNYTNYWEVRYVNPKVLKISYEIAIYADSVAQYNIRGKDIFGVEVTDKRLVDMQKSLFNYVWSTSQEMRILNAGGEAVLA